MSTVKATASRALRINRHRCGAAAVLALLVASAAMAHKDHGVHGPPIFNLRVTGEYVRLSADQPMQVEWSAKIERPRCDNGRPLSPTTWIYGTTSAVQAKPILDEECAIVATIHVKNVGVNQIQWLRAERVIGGAIMAYSIPVYLQPGYEARIMHTGEVGIYNADEMRLRDWRR